MNIKILNLAVIFLTCTLFYTPVSAAKPPARVIAGWVEKIQLENHPHHIKAKLDTGAKTSSIYARDIEAFKKDGQRWVRFTLHLTDSEGKTFEHLMEKPRSRKANIKNHDGDHDQRYVVDLNICFNGNYYTTEFTLADRSEFIYGILLGRRFLKLTALVDANKTFLTTPACKIDTALPQ